MLLVSAAADRRGVLEPRGAPLIGAVHKDEDEHDQRHGREPGEDPEPEFHDEADEDQQHEPRTETTTAAATLVAHRCGT